MSHVSERARQWTESFLTNYRKLFAEIDKEKHPRLHPFSLDKPQRVLVVVNPFCGLFAVGFREHGSDRDVIEAWTTRVHTTETELAKTLSSEGFFDPLILRLDTLLTDPHEYARHLVSMNEARLRDKYTDDLAEIGTKDLAMDHLGRFYGEQSSLSIIDPTKVLPLLSYVANREKTSVGDLGQCSLLLVQHLLGDFLSFAYALEAIGLDPKNAYVVGIPYSTKDYVVERLRSRGYNVLSPESYPFQEDVRKALGAVSVPFAIVEDGGYCLPILYREFQGKASGCVGIVEQTQNGIDLDRAFIKAHHAVKTPIVNVAECASKKEIEGRLVADAIVRNLKVILLKMGKGLTGKKVLVIGSGSVGKALADKLKDQDIAFVSAFDRREVPLAGAFSRGKATDDHLPNLVQTADIIIGCTGRTSMKKDELLKLKNNAILASASSKRVEIDVKELADLSTSQEAIKGVGTTFTLGTGNRVTLLANGLPINFFDSESVPDEEIQFVPALLFQSLVLLLTNKTSKGVNRFPKKIENDIVRTWRKLMGG